MIIATWPWSAQDRTSPPLAPVPGRALPRQGCETLRPAGAEIIVPIHLARGFHGNSTGSKCALVRVDSHCTRRGRLILMNAPPDVAGLDHYNLRAPRALLDELRTFYCEIVGLTVGERPAFRSFGYWLYAGGRAVVHLTESAPGESVAPGTTFSHAAFSCRGHTAYARRLARLGVRHEVTQVPHTGQVQLFLEDPAGNGVELLFVDGDA